MPAMDDAARLANEELAAFMAAYPQTVAIDAIFADLSAVVRGKRHPIEQAAAIFAEGLAFPGSTFLLDVVGENHDPCGRGFSDGDPDHRALPVPGSLKPVPWSSKPLAQVMLTFQEADGAAYAFEPRNLLARVVERFSDLGLKPVVAFELEFYLIDPARVEGAAPQPPISPLTKQREGTTQVYGMGDVEAFADLLEEISDSCDAQGVPAGAISSEYAPGQFEINLGHVTDPLLAADHCIMLQRAVRGVARKHGFQATFMAKPYPGEAGSGMHMHISLIDAEGRNVFDGGETGPASPLLHHAVAGILETLPESMAFLAPNINSYRRFEPDRFVPIRRSWAFENRSVALRIPLGRGHTRLIEHRMAGADANPYLALAATLAGLHHGLANRLDPPPETRGNAGTAFDDALPWRPRRAVEMLFGRVPILSHYLGRTYLETYAECKLAEMEKFEATPPPQEYRWYLLTG